MRQQTVCTLHSIYSLRLLFPDHVPGKKRARRSPAPMLPPGFCYSAFEYNDAAKKKKRRKKKNESQLLASGNECFTERVKFVLIEESSPVSPPLCAATAIYAQRRISVTGGGEEKSCPRVFFFFGWMTGMIVIFAEKSNGETQARVGRDSLSVFLR